ncbi:MAG: DUF2341 domain-containing protein [Euryarchaeota archaeon]|nr:DUF2341 domain-containing protein [Euryarchaeota archaeon]
MVDMSGWSKYKKIILTGGSSGAQTNYQLKLTVAYDSDMQADFDDLRFTQSDGTTLLDAWLESKTDSDTADVWVVFPTTPANGVEQTYYMYYGNPGASSYWDGAATFEFHDDFEDEGSIVLSFGNWIRNRASCVAGNYAYATETNGLHVVNISDIDNPSVVGYVALGSQTLDVEVDGNYAYVAVLDSNKLSVVDISTPSNPSEIGSVTDTTKLNKIHGIDKVGDYVYCCAYASGGANGYFTIVDVSTPSSPTIKGSVANDVNNYIKGSHDVQVIGNYAYLIASDHHVTDDGRFTIINIADKDNPSVVTSITGSEFHRSADIQIKGNYAFFGQFGYPSGAPANRYFRVIDISNVNSPFLAGGLAGYNMYIGYIHGDLIYCADNRYDTITVIDISTPTSPSFVKQFTIPGSTAVLHVSLTADGNHAVVARYHDTTNEKFYILDTQATSTVNWTIAESETGDTASATTKKLVMEKGGTAGYFSLTSNTSIQYSSKLFWDFSVEYPTGKRCNLVLNGDNANPSAGAIYLAFDTNGVRYYDTGYHTICSMDADTEYEISIVPNVSANTFDIYIYKNGVEVSYSGAHTGLAFRNAATYINQWRPVIYSANTEKGIYDNFITRKYAANPATYAFGEEISWHPTMRRWGGIPFMPHGTGRRSW